MDFDYKKYSLEKLEDWVSDALSSADVSPQEIYDVIKGVVDEQYHYHKHHTGRCYELLALLNGNGRGHIEAYDDYLDSKNKLKCDKDDPSPECKGTWNDFWEEHYYPEEYKGSTVSSVKQDKVKKWILPVEEVEDGDTGKQEYFITFPDDLLEAANLNEGDQIEWMDKGDGSFLLKKSWNDPYKDEMIAAGYKMVDGVWTLKNVPQTYDEMIAAGWTMTADGFWIKE
jgi:hypothetical protein